MLVFWADLLARHTFMGFTSAMPQKKVHFILKDKKNETFRLSYEVREHEIGEIWYRALQTAVPKGVSDRDLFHNFSKNPDRGLLKLISELKETLSKIRGFHPDLDIPDFDDSDIQNSVNILHRRFGHLHLDSSIETTPENYHLWHRFNALLHSLEFIIRDYQIRKRTGFPEAFINVNFHDEARSPIPDHLLEEFTLTYDFGYAYFAYAQVGRHITEIIVANDLDVPESHVRPFSNFSANCILWFGGNVGDAERKLVYKSLQAKFEAHPVFKKMNLKWGDPKLAVGVIPVGRLLHMPYTDKERHALIERISDFNEVDQVILE